MTTTIKIKSKRKGVPPLEFSYNFGEDFEDLTKLFHHDVIHTLFVATARDQLAAYVRRRLAQKKNAPTPEDLQAELDSGEWTPGRRRGKSALDKASDLVAEMTAEERAALIKQLQTPASPSNGRPHDETPSMTASDD